MKIELDDGLVRFSQVIIGQNFFHDGKCYMRILVDGQKNRAVEMGSGQVYSFIQTDVKVRPIRLKCVEDKT